LARIFPRVDFPTQLTPVRKIFMVAELLENVTSGDRSDLVDIPTGDGNCNP